MPTKPNERLIALKQVGGTKTLRVLPRERRARVIASLMLEHPAKPNSEKAAAIFAFSCAVGRDDPVRAKKIASKHGLNDHFVLDAVQSKVNELRAESEDGRSNLASDFEIIFRYNHSTIARFDGVMFDRVETALKDLSKGDCSRAHAMFTHILNEGKRLGVKNHEKDAAAGLAVCYLKRGMPEDSFKVIDEYLTRDGKLVPEAKELITEELGTHLMRVSVKALEEISRIAKAKGDEFFALVQDAVRNEISELDYTNLEACKTLYTITGFMGMEIEEGKLGEFLVDAYLSFADSQPGKFLEYYLMAADIASKLGMENMLDEAVLKYISICEELGESNPEYFEKGMLAAMSFGYEGNFADFAEKAFYGYLAAGELDKAEFIANESGMKELHRHIKNIMGRSEL